ncbi:MAG: valine--tRNA ligase [Oligoflexus sp.]
MSQMEAVYEPKKYESKWYQYWLDKGFFTAPVDHKKVPFTILMPPPNVTSQLHMGHGTGYSIQDLLVRWKRMKGFNACWLPGTDHAGIATQMMVEKELEKTGETRQKLGRKEFENRLHEWKEKYGGLILDQFKSMGFSCDWSKLAYTLDPKLSDAVRYVFVSLFKEGLIYRGERLVNWDPVLQTAISDDEVENKEINGHIWQFRYPLANGKDFISIATTRPETMLGDTAVAVHPDDERYKHLIGQQVRLPFTERLIPIIADDYVKSEFGTGAVKITPAHDPNDFDIGKRHQLPFINIMNDDATLNDSVPEKFRGLDRFVARKEVIRGLKELGLFEEEKSYKTTVPHSERSKTIIEPKLSLQWYVKMAELAQPAAEVARTGELQFYPDSWKKTYLYWLDNIQDWCISRQLWWGHRIPIWYCQDCQGVSTGLEDPSKCEHCGSAQLKQDEDVLDTWFSSWLWPLSPFGWPSEDSKDEETLEYFNPTDVLVTAPEIIFLWVARMVMVNLKFKQRLPFKGVYFNATVCDQQGRKFSKTLGNGIDPLEVIDQHGADAIRYTAMSLAPLGGRVRMAKTDFEHGARFVNKVWNASRFLLQHIPENFQAKKLADLDLNLPEKWLLHQLYLTAEAIDANLDQYRVNEAVDQLYHYIWGAFCDWGLECAKEDLGKSSQRKEESLSVLIFALEGALRLAHPVIPFITEEIWQRLPAHPDWPRPESIVVAGYPQAKDLKSFPEEAEQWKLVQAIITSIRSVRQQASISPKQRLSATARIAEDSLQVLTDSRPWILRLAGLDKFEALTEVTAPPQSLTQVGAGYEIFVPVKGLMDIDQERKRLGNEKARLEKILVGIRKKLDNENFVQRAPEDVLQQTKAQRQNLEEQLENIDRNLAALQA